jgi:hypothetical protein
MRIPISLAMLLTAFSLQAAELNQLSPQEKSAGWKLLFNGKDLNGWRLYGKQDKPGPGWKIEDGVLRKADKVNGGNIITKETFENFEFSWEWKIAPGGNNGIKYLVTEDRPSAPGPEYQMIDDENHPDGRRGPLHQTGSFYDVLPPIEGKSLKPVDEWNESKLVIRGNHVEHWLNGIKVLEYELGSDSISEFISRSKFKDAAGFGEKIKGHLMLTDHLDECSYRNLKIRELKP